ncbi:hypothetical protein C6P45_003958 [Maudiozyma exigua]|uniref:RFX-type winged-helix domain-containing protein n=1 Tax=Maudiozyma exigua TaxID=34358 RepID=A0A9P6WDC9_MAUEX|nr:hypothetical protein C6P45_003958 [Kazachstania exigua]
MESTPTVKDLGISDKFQSPKFQYNTGRTFSNGPSFNNNDIQSIASTSTSFANNNESQYGSPQNTSTGITNTNSLLINPNSNKILRPNVANFLAQPKIVSDQSLPVLSLPQPYRLPIQQQEENSNINNYYHYSVSPSSATHSITTNNDSTVYPMNGSTISPYHNSNGVFHDRHYSNTFIPQQGTVPQDGKHSFVAPYGASQPYIPTRNTYPPLWMKAQGDLTPNHTYNNFRKGDLTDGQIKLKSQSVTSPSPYNNNSSLLLMQYGNDTNNGNLIRRNTQEQIAKAIAEKNALVPLEEYAENVREAELAVLKMNDDTHSKSAIQRAEQNREREKHVYALLWLMRNCKAETNSYVPRSRIFSQYASSCAKSTLKPLSQATLGKLIRTIFPDITTRRLGMRGQSKYHYCNLGLLLESDISSRSGSNCHNLVGDNSAIKSQEISKVSNLNIDSKNGTDSNTNISGTNAVAVFTEIFKCNELPFGNSLQLSAIPIDEISSKIDPDIASSLESLYHVYCLSIFENIFYMKFEELPNCLNLSSNGSLSPQMFSLLISSELYDWVYECDLKTHAVIIQEISKKLINEETITDTTLQSLEKFINSYKDIVAKSSLDLPIPMVENKVLVANRFCAVLKELVKLLSYSKAFLTDFRECKTGMVNDWKTLVIHGDFYDLPTFTSQMDNLKSEEKDSLNGADFSNNSNSMLKTRICDDISTFLQTSDSKMLQLNHLIEQFCKFITHKGNLAAQNIITYYLQFFGGLVGELSLKSSENLRCWLYFNNIISQLLSYSDNFRNLISMVK